MKLSQDDAMPLGELQPDNVRLSGTYVDTIVDVSEQLSYMKQLLPLVKLLALVYKIRSPPPSEECHMSTLMRTLSADSLHSTTTERYPHGFTRTEVVQSFSRLLSPVLNGLSGLDDFEKAIGASDNPETFKQFWALDDRNLLTEAVSGGSPLAAAAAAEADIPFLEVFVRDKTRRLALTHDHGALVLVPHSTRPGDEVWTMAREDSLVVVNRNLGLQEPASVGMRVLGECYSHGFSKGIPAQGCKDDYSDMEFLTSSVAVGLAGAVPN
ncbi:hypothetical protein CTRI78_v008397 [Colletotrichum trifolii]|uniref:Uncharacterized protein n=1 Tax=Colletotrichum trifolii TaxID=5466 RepID=A0A4R8QWG9_COLTR|nr:hypothetical protein CTRI78_v008397 [Colletotrichum trifolii]